jgi:hypothetical protein
VERAHEFLKTETGPNTWMAAYSIGYQLGGVLDTPQGGMTHELAPVLARTGSGAKDKPVPKMGVARDGKVLAKSKMA